MNFFKKRNYKEQFNQIYKEYYRVVYKNILYITGDTHAAEDLTQETFIKYYNYPPQHSNIMGWLTKVSSNLSFNYLRDKKLRNSKDEKIINYAANEFFSIEDISIKNYELGLIRKVLNSLSDRDRTCLLLKFSGYKYDEIADITKINKTSVGSILARAQRKFKKAYLKEVEDEGGCQDELSR